MSFMSRMQQSIGPKPKCLKCGLSKVSPYPKVQPLGCGDKGIAIIMAVPPTDNNETYQAIAFQLRKLNVNIYDDCWVIPAIACLPVEKKFKSERTPTMADVKNCFPQLEASLLKLKPKKIILIADQEGIVVNTFYKDRYSITSLMIRGNRLHDSKYNCYVYPIYENHLLSSRDLPMSIVRRDIENALVDTKVFQPTPDHKDHLKVLTNFTQCAVALQYLNTVRLIAFDYETTGLKPFKEGQKVVSVSVTTESLDTYSMPLCHDHAFTPTQQQELKRLWREILINPNVHKIIHNYNFEYMWSAVAFRCIPRGFYWDTQLCTHVLDNRTSVTKLKHQLFMLFGIEDYSSSITPYLEGIEPGGNAFNRVLEIPLQKELVYNGIDSFGTMMLYKDQKSKLTGKRLGAFKFMMRSVDTLSKMQVNGLHTSEDYYIKVQKEIEQELIPIIKEITTDPDVQSYQAEYNKEFLFTSVDHLKEFFFKHMGFEPPKTTEKGNEAVDVEVLGKLQHPIAAKIMKYRKLEKLKSTYINNILLESHKNVMHPFFSLNTVATFRSSSSSINFQNLPKRDKESMKRIRSGIIPAPDFYLSESDYSGAEVVTSHTYHKDKNFYRFLTDSSADMHRHVACKAFMMDEDKLIQCSKDDPAAFKECYKPIRRDSKALTFGWFYGSYWGLLAPIAWEFAAIHKLHDGTPLKEHLHNCGIHSLRDFEKHMQDVEVYFWNEMFPEYTQWKKDIVAFYKRYGYIDTHFGFRFTAPMDEKQCTNYPIQSTSFHMLLFVLNDIIVDMAKAKLRSKLVGQIHDSIIGHVHKDEVVEYHDIIVRRVADLQNRLPWLTIPMEVECDISKLGSEGGNFAAMSGYKRENYI